MERARPQMAFPRPGTAIKSLLAIMFGTWLVFSLAINWGGVSAYPLEMLNAAPGGILTGQLWRPLTALFIHDPGGIGHILMSMFMVYMFGTSLEESWGPKRYVRFVLLSGAISYVIQALVSLVLPAELGGRLIGPFAFGSGPMIEASVIAWACSFRGRTVYLFFALPVTTKQLILFTVGINVLMLITLSVQPAGFIAMFAGMGMGWLLGGDTPSPLRRFYLGYKMGQLDREVEAERQARKKRVKKSGLRVVHGDDDEPPPKDMLN